MTKEIALEIFKDCFIEIIEDDYINLSYKVTTGVSDSDNLMSLFSTKEELKIYDFDCERYRHVVCVRFIMKDLRNTLNESEYNSFREKYNEKFDIALDKYYFSMNSEGFYSTTNAKYKFEAYKKSSHSDIDFNLFVYSNDEYEYLPIVIESKLVEKK